MAQGPYEIPKIDYSAIAAMTNTAPNGAFRGAGRPEAAAMLERLLDLAAVELDLTPEEIRRRNLIPKDAFPYTTRTGLTYDVGDYEAALQEALRLADVEALRAEQARRDRGRARRSCWGSASRRTSRSPASAATSSAACGSSPTARPR